MVSENEHLFSHLVVVGASAGGIEALSLLVSTLPEAFPAPIVIAQHLSPHHASTLAEILAKRAPIPVETVRAQQPLKPGVIYVIPPDRDVSITDHEIRIHSDDGAGPRPSIDLLFRSAAEAYREDLIAVILSGTGSDGSTGAREVKQLGGTVIIQDPDSASFPGMPLSLAPSTVDIVANPEAIGPLLHDLITGVFTTPQQSEEDQFRNFLDQLREETGIDFSTYKQPTISRRLQRRMAATNNKTLPEYVRYLRQHPQERQRLVGSFLIKVTEFYRDPDLYQYLGTRILPELITAARTQKSELRIWSAGCATGEEAYSLAILVADLLRETESEIPVRIFATDLDPDAIAFARRGIYPARALLSLSTDIIARHFTERDGEYEVNKETRALVVFGEHDLGQRAPFPRIDLILCRNVLIYFTPALQRRSLQLFAFSLRTGGYLVLGKSETVTPLADYFSLEQSRLKIYRRVGQRVIIPPGRVKDPAPVMLPPARIAIPQPTSLSGMSRTPVPGQGPGSQLGPRAEVILLNLPIGVVAVNSEYDIQFINTIARRMLGIHDTAVGKDFLHMLQHIPTASLRTAIDHAIEGKSRDAILVTAEGTTDVPQTLQLTCYPIKSAPSGGQAMVAITITDVSEAERTRQSLASATSQAQRLGADNEQLLAANLDLMNTITRITAENDELAVSSEEIQAATEEVETLNEELQASNEELETLNEELQASNEELETLNEELQATIEELHTTNDDLQARTIEHQELALASESARAYLDAVFSSISDAVLVVNDQGRAVTVNDAYQRMFGSAETPLIPEDTDGHQFAVDESPQTRAARGETFSISFTLTRDGGRRWYEAECRPVATDQGRLSVITIRDITDRSLRHLQDEWLAIAAHELRTPIAALQGYLQLTRRETRAEKQRVLSDRLDRALTQVRRISQLVDQMVDATRFQYGRIELQFADVDLVSLIEDVVESVTVLPGDARIAFHHPEGPVQISGDVHRLEQVMFNLLTNAVSHASRPVTIDVTLTESDTTVEIVVADNGSGISPDILPTIFDRFSQGGGVRAGLGLGLFVSREIVTSHGGTITAESTPGNGATFTVVLPIAQADGTSRARPERGGAEGSTRQP